MCTRNSKCYKHHLYHDKSFRNTHIGQFHSKLMNECPRCLCYVETNKHPKQECDIVNFYFLFFILLIYLYALYFQLMSEPKKASLLYDDVPGGNGLSITSLKRPGSNGAETDASIQVLSGDEQENQVRMTVCITCYYLLNFTYLIPIY